MFHIQRAYTSNLIYLWFIFNEIVTINITVISIKWMMITTRNRDTFRWILKQRKYNEVNRCPFLRFIFSVGLTLKIIIILIALNYELFESLLVQRQRKTAKSGMKLGWFNFKSWINAGKRKPELIRFSIQYISGILAHNILRT